MNDIPYQNSNASAEQKIAQETIQNNNHKDPRWMITMTWRRIAGILILGFLLIIAVSCYCYKNGCSNPYAQFWSVLGIAMLIGGASFAAGGIGGFIFGIPSMVQSNNTIIKNNDNLIQISDWLTKIIVGVGLVELTKTPHKIKQIGEYLQPSFGGNEWGRNASMAIVFYFFFFGFLIVYFWTRTDFTKIIYDDEDERVKKAEADTQKAIKAKEEIQKAKDEMEKVKEKTEKIANTVTTEKTKEKVAESQFAAYSTTIDETFGEKATVKDAVEALKAKVKEVLEKKKPTVSDDLQKNRWGGKNENNGKIINANVTAEDDSGYYQVEITVANKDGSDLNQPVAIFVHDSFQFPDDAIYVAPENKVARIILYAYEAFTIGALLADGTELELDLNEQKDYPKGFYWTKDQDLK